MTKAELRQAVEWMGQQADLGDDQLLRAIDTVLEMVEDDTVEQVLKTHGRINEDGLAKMRARRLKRQGRDGH
jgi:hypothetical protein